MTTTIPACPQCGGQENTYQDGDNFVCADCAHEWPQMLAAHTDDENDRVVTTLKMGTKVKSIRLVGGDHEVDCKMDTGNYMLKACFLRKA